MKTKGKYKFYNDNNGKVIAVSTYAGHTVRGVAKCDPRDKFDITKGQDLAMARCAEKIAAKRAKRATQELAKALENESIARRRTEKMENYQNDAFEAWNKAMEARKNLEREF